MLTGEAISLGRVRIPRNVTLRVFQFLIEALSFANKQTKMFRVILPQYLNEIIKVEGTDGSTYKDVVINALQQYFSLKEIDQLVITVFTIEGLPLDEQSQMTDKP